jgi:predicted acylesterase/phospholipase RssA
MLASASQPILFPLIEIADDHQQYCDGGVVEVVPLKLPLDLGADILDVIVLTPERAGPEPHVYTTFLDTMIRTLEVLIESATVADIAHAQFINEAVRAWRTTGTVPDGGRLAGKRVVQLNLIRPHTSLTTNALRFDPSEMQGMMALGRIAGAISVAQQDATP